MDLPSRELAAGWAGLGPREPAYGFGDLSGLPPPNHPQLLSPRRQVQPAERGDQNRTRELVSALPKSHKNCKVQNLSNRGLSWRIPAPLPRRPRSPSPRAPFPGFPGTAASVRPLSLRGPDDKHRAEVLGGNGPRVASPVCVSTEDTRSRTEAVEQACGPLSRRAPATRL